MACSKCNTPNCGCTGTYTVAATCPPACSEVFNAQCIVYTGVDLTCDGDTVISRNDYLDTAITKLVNYVCSKVAPPTSVVAGSAFIDVVPNTDPVTLVTTYTVSADMAAFEIWVAPIITNQILAKVLAGPGIDVAPDAVAGTVTVSHEDTSSVTDLSSNNTGNSFIQSINFTFDTYGHVTGASAVPGTVVNADNFGQFDITDTDPGTYIWSSVGSAIAANPGDTFTVLSGEGIDVDVDVSALAMRVAFAGLTTGAGLSGVGTAADPLVNAGVTSLTSADANLTVDTTTGDITITNDSPATDVTLASAGGETLVTDGTGADLEIKGLTAGAGITLTANANDIEIATTVARQIQVTQDINVTGSAFVTPAGGNINVSAQISSGYMQTTLVDNATGKVVAIGASTVDVTQNVGAGLLTLGVTAANFQGTLIITGDAV
jgi:hypothetical protein